MLRIKNAYAKVLVILTFTLIIVLAVCFPAVAAANPDVVEASQVRVVINGVAGAYTDVALEINDRIMLPFREVLTKLGVANDDEHIIWNQEEESVTVLDGRNTVKLQIGNYNMSVNGVEKKYDVAPYFYEKNDRTYIPVRAVSELLDKQIMWEEATSTVYIRDKANYEETIALLENIQKADKDRKMRATADSIVNLRISTDSGPIPGADEDGVLRAKMNLSQLIMADFNENIYQVKQALNFNNLEMSSEMFFYNNKVYVNSGILGINWQEAGDLGVNIGAPTDQIMLMESQMNARPLSDIAMGMAMTKSSDGSYSLTGEPLSISDLNIIMDSMSAVLPQDTLTDLDMKFNNMQIGMTFDSQYYPLRAVALINFEFNIKEQTADGNYETVNISADINMTINYDRSDLDFTITVPQEIIDLT